MATSEIDKATTELLGHAVTALGGARRDGQVLMSCAVARALANERHLAVQAGTGTGKSLAYLVPAAAHAIASEQSVVVSTATIALQRQLVGRDLPRLAKALEPHLDRPLTFAILKGRSNYICLNKLATGQAAEDGLLSEEELSGIGKEVRHLSDWAQDTDTGDRDDLEEGVSNLAWRQLSVTANECLGASRCPQAEECFAEAARKKAREADIIVTNHALLAIDALAEVDVLPQHDAVIIDEAHELDGRITGVATNELTANALVLAARRAKKLGADGKDDELVGLADDWPIVLDSAPRGRWTTLPEEVAGPLVKLRDTLWSVRTAIHTAPDGEAASDPEKNAERHHLSQHLVELHDTCVRILGVFEQEDPAKQVDVVWLSDEPRRGATLRVAPLSVSGLLATRLFAEKTVVLTSATLTVGGNFQAMAASWGLAKGSYDHLDAGTPFDPAKSGILYVPVHLPEPGRDGLSPEALAEIKDLIMAAGGRTLGLFSSRRAAEQAAEFLRPRIPMDVLCQGEDSTPNLIKRFAANENAVLVGTLTLWQGVDVPGKSCSVVIMDRIPFPRPDDPLLQARKEAADAAGRNGFMEVAATHAALLMAQGAGRLLRHVDDRGVVAVLDTRLVSKRYGGFLRASMPAFWPTTDKKTVISAIKRLISR
ncbi:ATP-dependent DNA helicase [Corynebacterium aquilae]|uniref:ATP-dependent helicase DinG n=1 Tax=Corynebacterium aquilae DSM 44791 TaxID=1431546 RepID=A0A1L7CHV8_9CORY|nr:ATP-dependent DNA helicase [Corynebacterium aquilae]APT85353.1 ATP-dependent helicase [Corynebacterium aquilae DSM 44791]